MPIARLFAAAIALCAWAGLAVQFAATFAQTGSIAATVGTLLRFFTVIANLLVALVMTAIASGRRVPGFWLGGLTLAVLLVGLVHATLLRGLLALSGGALLADTLLHIVVPTAVTLFWLLCADHGELRWRDPLWWALFPLAYLGYALVRGAIEYRYAYPFIDVATIGAAQTAINALLMAAGFVAGGLVLVAIDARLAQSRAGDRRPA